jgi:nicotinate-nucleotide--dimethylbenzimidazole phosphoribosyltransferase
MLQELISKIGPLDQNAMEAARQRQDLLTKPQGSLGRLEELSIQVAGITGQSCPRLHGKAVLVMAGDHGVVAEGVSAYPQEVTPQMVLNFLQGGAAINVLARHVGAKVVIADMGVAADLPAHPALINCKVGRGTNNMARGPAMTRTQAIQAIEAGAQVALGQIDDEIDLFATGDMGIGNTTPSAAIAAVFTGRVVEDIAGRGAGVDDAGLQRKISAIQRAIEVNRPNPQNGLDVLSKVGGFEIAGLAGAILACAAMRKVIVIDGFISTAAAMIADSLSPNLRGYLIAAHTSQERGHHLMMDWLNLQPLLDLKMRLGEGTGAALAMSLVDAACKTLTEMATFGEAGVAEKTEE